MAFVTEMWRGRLRAVVVVQALFFGCAPAAFSQSISQRGFIDARAFLFPQEAPNDGRPLVVDLVGRAELFVKPTPWLQFAAGVDARANSHNQVKASWALDVRDRGTRRPALSLRRASATLVRGELTVDVGKQFLRWGKADIVTPTDHLAPRDFLNVIDSEFLPLTGVRAVIASDAHALEAVWVPWLTPSRTPLLSQRWTVVPPEAGTTTFDDVSGPLPGGSQGGIRWSRTATGYEYSVSYFRGFNHLPNVEIQSEAATDQIEFRKIYPRLDSYGFDLAVPTRWFTVKAEAAYSTSKTPRSDEYVVYVLQLERQTGEWMLVGGYAGEIVTKRRAAFVFAPDRGLTRSIVARASYTVDANRSVAVESAVRQSGGGVYAKGEYSQARGQHWRTTVTGAVIAGRADDFLGQYRRNSHVSVALRYSF